MILKDHPTRSPQLPSGWNEGRGQWTDSRDNLTNIFRIWLICFKQSHMVLEKGLRLFSNSAISVEPNKEGRPSPLGTGLKAWWDELVMWICLSLMICIYIQHKSVKSVKTHIPENLIVFSVRTWIQNPIRLPKGKKKRSFLWFPPTFFFNYQ